MPVTLKSAEMMVKQGNTYKTIMDVLTSNTGEKILSYIENNNLNKWKPIRFNNTGGYYNIESNNTVTLKTNNNYNYTEIPCSYGDIFKINAASGQETSYPWILVDENDKVITHAQNKVAENETVQVPFKAKKLLISNAHTLQNIGNTSYIYSFTTYSNGLNNVGKEQIFLNTVNARYTKKEDDTISISYNFYCDCAMIPCKPGEEFEVHVKGRNSTNPYLFIDENNKVINYVYPSNSDVNGTITMPSGAMYFILQSNRSAATNQGNNIITDVYPYTCYRLKSSLLNKQVNNIISSLAPIFDETKNYLTNDIVFNDNYQLCKYNQNGEWDSTSIVDELFNIINEISIISNELNIIQQDKKIIKWNIGRYGINLNSALVYSSATTWQYADIECKEDDIFTVDCMGLKNNSIEIPVWIFLDSNNEILNHCEDYGVIIQKYIIAPPRATRLILNNQNAYSTGKCYYGKYILNDQIQYLETAMKTNLSMNNLFTLDGYLKDNGFVPENNNVYNHSTYFISVNKGDILYYCLYAITDYQVVQVFDENKDIISSIKGNGLANKVEGEYSFSEKGYVRLATRRMDESYAYINNNLLKQLKNKVQNVQQAVQNIQQVIVIPSWWTDAVAEAIQDCYDRDKTLTSGDRFFFITDPHWHNSKNPGQQDNYGRSSDLISYIAEKTGIQLVLCGGDIVWSYAKTQSDAMQEIRDYFLSFKNKNLRILSVAGNHDSNMSSLNASGVTETNNDIGMNNGEGDTANATLRKSQMYNVLGRQMEYYAQTYPEHLCFCYDNKSQKIRYIGFNFYESIKEFDQTQYILDPIKNWIETKVNEVKKENYTIILMSHSYWSTPKAVTETQDKHDYYFLYPGNTFKQMFLSLKRQGAKIAAWFVGHIHLDYSQEVEENGTKLWIIGTRTDNGDLYTNSNAVKNYHSDAMTKDSSTEQAFDIVYLDTNIKQITMYRVGGYQNQRTRTFDYTFTEPIIQP